MTAILVDILTKVFPQALENFMEDPPFRKCGQYDNHKRTIEIRRSSGSIDNTMRDDMFFHYLYETLKAWGIGQRGSILVPFYAFKSRIRGLQKQFSELEGFTIEMEDDDISHTVKRIWNIIDKLKITENESIIVSGTKTIHHLLPDLVVPTDNEYTKPFFDWNTHRFRNHQRACFVEAFYAFSHIARSTLPTKYVGNNWNTSSSKVIDNAIIGFMNAPKEQILSWLTTACN